MNGSWNNQCSAQDWRRQRRTVLTGYGNRGDAVGINGRQVGATFTNAKVSIEERSRYSESTEYLSDLQLVAIYFILVVLGVWRVRPPLESPLDFGCKPEVDV